VDDEPLARRRLIRLLGRIPDTEVAGEARNGEEALARVRELQPDVVLLDIRMPGLDGLALARRAAELPPVVFVTAYDEHAVEAFEANAVDYLLKPVQLERLATALTRARKRAASDAGKLDALLREILERRSREPEGKVAARLGSTIRVFDARDIARFHAEDRYTIFRHEGQEFLLDEPLNALEARLGELGFVRVHRAELVNVHRVKALHLEDGATEVELTDGQRAPVSRRQAGELRRRLGMGEGAST
jgi:DNA-binding LytR/AlgR family response regulator